MTGDHLCPAGDHHLVDVAADQNLAVPVGGRYRVVGAAAADKGHLLPDFYSGATGLPGRFSEGFSLRRLQR